MEARSSPAFQGLRVVDLTEGIAGPLAARMFAGHGAEVIKVERPRVGDVARRFGPNPHGTGDAWHGGWFHFLNMGKLAVTLDFTRPETRTVFTRLIERADLVFESSRPGDLDRVGLGYPGLAAMNPRVIVVSVTPFGQSGPYRNFKSTELVIHALSGEMHQAGEANRPPLQKGGHLAQIHGGLHAFIAASAAVYAARSTESGQHVDVSLLEAWASVAGASLKAYAYTRQTPKRVDRRESFPGGLRRCRDGWVVILGRGRRDWWPNFLEAVGDHSFERSRFSTQEGRNESNDELDILLNEWLLQHDRKEIYRRFQTSGLPAAYVSDADDLLHSDQLLFRAYWERAKTTTGHDFQFPGRPYQNSRVPWFNAAAPGLGEHNAAVFGGLLGVSPIEWKHLEERGFI